MLQAGMVGGARGVLLEELEREGGRCPECARRAELWTCGECGLSAWVIDCAHRGRPAWLRRGRSDGSQRAQTFCGDCGDVLPARVATA